MKLYGFLKLDELEAIPILGKKVKVARVKELRSSQFKSWI